MVLKKSDKICLRCRHYRPVDEFIGRCRLDRGTIEAAAYPEMKHEDSCASWKDAGQQYFIRLGWVKRQRNPEDSGAG
jgi:hypothetical protein